MSRLTEALKETIHEAVKQNACPGAAWAILRAEGVIEQGVWGHANPDEGIAVSPDTIYDAASLTKPIATATSVCLLIEQGKLSLDQTLKRWFSDAPSLQEVSLRHLITHTSGLPPFKAFWKEAKGKEAVLNLALQTPLARKPGVGYAYSDIGYMLLAAVVEKVGGQSIDEFARQNVLTPLGMSDSGYTPSEEKRLRIAVTGHCSMRDGQTLCGVVHDPNAAAMDGVAGHAGLFTTLPDLCLYAQMVLNGGMGRKARLLSPASIREMSISQIDAAVGAHTLGWFAYPNGYLPRADLLSRASFGHTGFTGTALVFDPLLESALILLTNRVYSDPDGGLFLGFRKRILNVMAAIASEAA